MAERRVTIQAADPLLLFGTNDQHLRRVESAFPDTQITARGDQLILRGKEEAFEEIVAVLDEFARVLKRHGHITENDVETILSLRTGGNGSQVPEPGADDVIVYAPAGGAVRPRTPNQIALVSASRKNDIVFAIGPAGTGKTYTAVALAVAALKARVVKRIVLCRPAVEAGEQLGFLPGNFRDKVDPYLRPLYDALGDMMHVDKLNTYIDQNTVEILPLAYMRGRTLNSSFVILDEAQNATTRQMKMFLTRIGTNSRVIVTGDITQIDLPYRERSGLIQARNILSGVAGISFVSFDRNDVVRHRLVMDIIDAYDKLDEGDDNSF